MGNGASGRQCVAGVPPVVATAVMGKKLPMPNAQCPMPQAAGQLSLSTHKGMEFPAAFNQSFLVLLILPNA
ncbi:MULTISPECIES: hypothetical protein [unclassified Tolypothrix]|nr:MULTISPECIES: hypothetical protein [unclassified Tolypothrix]UYD25884.1 hypothetical protein HGR01_31915 [Tolypothrix sp. PCC 7712]